MLGMWLSFVVCCQLPDVLRRRAQKRQMDDAALDQRFRALRDAVVQDIRDRARRQP
jgi:hypothetical protein